VVTGYSLAYAVGVPLFGRISDFFGVRAVFSIGLAGFAVGGLVCALAPSLTMLVFGRIVQGIGGAAVPALAIVSVAKVLPAGERGAGIGLIGASLGAAAAVGPVLGGLIGQFLGWRALFVGTLALALVLIPFARRVLPDGGSEGGGRGERAFDLLGGVLLGLAAGLFLFGVTRGQDPGFASFSSWGSFVGAAVSAALFVWRIKRVPRPFVSPALFENRGYVAAVLVGFLAMLANLSTFVLTPLLLIGENGLSVGAAGLALTPGAAAQALLSPLSGRLSDRVGAKVPIMAGLALMLLSLLFISTLAAGAGAVAVAAGVLGLTTSMALVHPPLTNAAAGSLPQEEVGGGIGIFQGLLFLGGGTGPALTGAFLAAREQAAAGAINPAYALDAAAFSDVFLALGLAPAVALIAASGLRGRGDKNGVAGDPGRPDARRFPHRRAAPLLRALRRRAWPRTARPLLPPRRRGPEAHRQAPRRQHNKPRHKPRDT
jgi:DHA2 family metal-tetracycline-proton antiporter-like MFS transporter/DHA2 family florfenicol/chloramphenicol resistance protein-like MFS transporter